MGVREKQHYTAPPDSADSEREFRIMCKGTSSEGS